LSQIGFKVHLLEGGYKGFRQQVIEDIPRLIAPLRFHIISGRTGSGKTRLLQTLKRVGAQVLDLEELACHRSSVLGQLPGVPQPSQKHFDTLIWAQLGRFNAEEVIFVESESKKVGNLTVPEGLIEKMRQSPCTNVELSMSSRVELLMQDYAFMALDPAFFIKKLEALVPARGKALIDQWTQWILEGHIRQVVQELLEKHYDPTYDASMKRNFQLIDSARRLSLDALEDLNESSLADQLRLEANE
jgi:tRNA 2-selenouridine synthase